MKRKVFLSSAARADPRGTDAASAAAAAVLPKARRVKRFFIRGLPKPWFLSRQHSKNHAAAHITLRGYCPSCIAVTMRLADFDFALPRELIADRPAEPRDRARLLVLEAEGEIA